MSRREPTPGAVPLRGRSAPADQAAGPVTHVTADAPPFLILHGTDDSLVPPAQGEQLAAALRQAGARVARSPAPATHGRACQTTTSNAASPPRWTSPACSPRLHPTPLTREAVTTRRQRAHTRWGRHRTAKGSSTSPGPTARRPDGGPLRTCLAGISRRPPSPDCATSRWSGRWRRARCRRTRPPRSRPAWC
ncbi:prolyl oligopeptidase family serine peptidase [Streptomyces sp. DT190]|uniref:prolyl oligopeptidase family serine peptidase n=1 Tax=unclassified Streptomyces TaxID=2593676 RepID=UPI003CF07B1A